MSFFSQVWQAGIPRTSKADIVDYYHYAAPHKGKGGWKQQIVRKLAEMTGQKTKTLEKRFDPQRLNDVEPKNASQYKELGASLPPMPPENGYHVTGTIWVKYSEDCVDRNIDVTVTGDEARRLANMAGDAMIQAIANTYQSDNPDGDIDFKGPSWCAEPDLHVEALD